MSENKTHKNSCKQESVKYPGSVDLQLFQPPVSVFLVNDNQTPNKKEERNTLK